jgi:hypothetical protein
VAPSDATPGGPGLRAGGAVRRAAALIDNMLDLARGRLGGRYSGGLAARPLLFLRQHLSDRMFDRLTMFAFW